MAENWLFVIYNQLNMLVLLNPFLNEPSKKDYLLFQDKKADLVISTYVDVIMEKVLKRLGVELPEYTHDIDPTKQTLCDLEWTIPIELINDIDKQYKCKLKSAKKQRSFAETSEKNTKKVKKEEQCTEIKQE